jgi:two-component system, NarL family, nitrate/nitrite response regulator NarL
MNSHILITTDSEIRQRWLQAFPDARVLERIPDAASIATPACTVWIHLPAERADAARLISLASRSIPEARLVALSDTPTDAQALDLMERGAVGYCHSHAGGAMLGQVATVVANQGLWVGTNLLQRLIRASLGSAPSDGSGKGRLDDLSGREREVADLVGRGSSNKEIARRLDITERTVKAHLSAIFMKLGVRDRLHLALLVRQTPDS